MNFCSKKIPYGSACENAHCCLPLGAFAYLPAKFQSNSQTRGRWVCGHLSCLQGLIQQACSEGAYWIRTLK